MKALAILAVLILSPALALANPVINEYSGYRTIPDCYGSGCLPTTLLREVIDHPNAYNQNQVNVDRQLDLLEESNDIAREQLELEQAEDGSAVDAE
jgi:hypothetical protein